MRCTALIVAFGFGAFITVAGQPAQASEEYAPAFASAPHPATTLDQAYAEPRYAYRWRPWTLRRWSYGSRYFAPRWPDWSRRPAWRYGWTYRAPYDRNRSYGWRQQPWPRWRTWPYDGGYRGYAAHPWHDR
jgi:hypothetical protein